MSLSHLQNVSVYLNARHHYVGHKQGRVGAGEAQAAEVTSAV